MTREPGSPARKMPCGHPFAARQVTIFAIGGRREDRRLKTT